MSLRALRSGGMPNDNNAVEATNRAHKSEARHKRHYLQEYVEKLALWVSQKTDNKRV
jgi:hypothetical protein